MSVDSFNRLFVANFIKPSISKLIRIFVFLVPKNDRLIVFVSDPDLTDNPKALYDWANANSNQFTLIWLVRNKSKVDVDRKIFYTKSVRGIWSFLRAKTFVNSHNQYAASLMSKNQFSMSLGHGLYLKTMGYMKPRHTIDARQARKKVLELDRVSSVTKLAITTSDTFRSLLNACYNFSFDNIKVTGLPRMDEMFSVDREEVLKFLFPDLKSVSKIITIMPTHRRNEEGVYEGVSLLEQLVSLESGVIFDGLLEKEIAIIIKPHPFEFDLVPKLTRQFCSSNIKILTGSDEDQYTTYNILGVTDLLVTDYSSVYLEYLALDRPILFFKDDNVSENYESTRGLLVSPYEFWTPGVKVSSVVEMLQFFISDEWDAGDWPNKRKTLKEIVHQYCDANNSKRTWEEIERFLSSEK